jgi:hypothetical protein
MCLTLGAENAKLMNLLASKTCTPLYRPTLFAQEAVPSFFYSEQHWPAPNSFPNQFSTQSIVAMSDAGIHRAYSAMSEDGTDIHPSVVAIVENQNTSSWQARGDSVHSVGYRTSGCGTYADSDTSFERNLGQESIAFNRVHHHDAFFGPIPLHGIKSRLSEDITRYMNSLQSQLKKAEGRRIRAVEGITKTVKASSIHCASLIYISCEVALSNSILFHEGALATITNQDVWIARHESVSTFVRYGLRYMPSRCSQKCPSNGAW